MPVLLCVTFHMCPPCSDFFLLYNSTSIKNTSIYISDLLRKGLRVYDFKANIGKVWIIKHTPPKGTQEGE